MSAEQNIQRIFFENSKFFCNLKKYNYLCTVNYM